MKLDRGESMTMAARQRAVARHHGFELVFWN
jgi:hypothetical protein